jgi:thiamine kinase-like enzyme
MSLTLLTANLERLLDEIPLLGGQPRTITPLPGGLTNLGYKVVAPALTAVARLAPENGSALGIDRETEYRNATAAHAAGIGPPVLAYLPDSGLLVTAWVEGRPLRADDLHDPEQLARLAGVCRTLHERSSFSNEVDIAAVRERYLVYCLERGYSLPDGYLDHERAISDLVAAVRARPEEIVPCHNDLVPANVIDDGVRLRVIDFEYSGNNDPCFEFGSIAAGSSLSVHQLSHLMRSYYGRDRPSRIARARLYTLLAHHTWALWAAIQDAESSVSADFIGWGSAEYERSRRGLRSPLLPALLDSATGVN